MQRKWIWLAGTLVLALAVAPALVAQTSWVVAGNGDGDDDDGPYVFSGSNTIFLGDEDGAFLGVTMEEETESDEGGARIMSVVDDSPADKAGLRVDDVVIRFGKDTIRGPASLTKKIRDREPGESVEIVVLRDGDRRSFDVELGERDAQWRQWAGVAPRVLEQLENLEIPDYEFNFNFDELKGQLEGMNLEGLAELQDLPELEGLRFFGEPGQGLTFDCEDGDCNYRSLFFGGGRPRLGVQLTEVTPELREHLGGDADNGVLVSKVIEDSAAEDAGVEVGDLIVDVDGDSVSDTGDLRRALSKREGETFDIEVIRDGRSRRLSVTLEVKEKDVDRPTGPRALYRVQPGRVASPAIAARVAQVVPRAVAPRVVSTPSRVTVVAPEAPLAPPSAVVAPAAPAIPIPGVLAAPRAAPAPAAVPRIQAVPVPRAPLAPRPVLAGGEVI